jgi:hypothetical protein
METDIILSKEGIRSNIVRKKDNGNCPEEYQFVLLVDFLDHDDTVTAGVY